MDSIRQYRILDIAIADVVLSYIAAVYILSKYRYAQPYLLGLGVFVIGIVTHYVLGIPTALNYKLGISDNPRPKEDAKK